MRKSRKRAGKLWLRPGIFAGAACILAAAALAVILPLTLRKKADVSEPADAKVKESVPVREADASLVVVAVEDTVITGLAKEEARKVLEKKYAGVLAVQGPEETKELENPVVNEIGRLLETIPPSPAKDLNLSFDYGAMEEEIRRQIAALAETWDRKPADSVVVSYDKGTGAYEYSDAREGRTLDQQRLTENLMKMIREARYDRPAEAEFSVTPAARSRAQAKEQYQVIGTFTTKLTENKNRNKNVTLAAEAIDGLILQPGEEFSFNQTTGNRTSEKGYQPAGAYRNGVLIEEPGGGVCQVSTTLYHSIIESGFKTTERNAHSFAPSYVEKGQDAMVSFDGYAGPDLKFINTSSAPIVLRASVQGLSLKLSIVGIPILEDGMKVTIRSEKVGDVEAPEPNYEENPELPFGTEKVVENGQGGSVWKSYRVVTKNGETVKEEPLHNSRYKSKTAQIQRNTTVPQAQDPAGEDDLESEGGMPAETGAGAAEPEGSKTGAGGAGQIGRAHV